ncbi:MAG: beta-N-acetylhexosaminidase [Clostridia bacterium]
MNNLIPRPNFFKHKEGQFIVDKSVGVTSCEQFKEVKLLLENLISKSIGSTLQGEKGIEIICEPTLDVEAYAIKVTPTLITLSASTVRGAIWGLQTLRQIANLDFSHKSSIILNCFQLKDKPRFSYRGLHFDIARHFFDKLEIMRLIDLASRVKINVLHLHLSDDQGWRMQIDGYPELTNNSACVINYAKSNRQEQDGKVSCGFLTKQDLKEIIAYAQKLGVDIMPEIDFPGHTQALLMAMPELSCESKQISLWESWGVSKHILCAGNVKVYKVLEDIFSQVCELFPYPYIHIGGDEAPKDEWKKCSKCKAKLNELGLANYEQLQSYMFNYIEKFLQSRGKIVVGWNECLSDKLSNSVVVEHWTSRLMRSRQDTIKHINRGRKAIIAYFTSTYLDYSYAMTPISRVYNFNPIFKGITKQGEKNVLGMECCVWTEHIPNRKKLDFNLFPRLYAFAENAWSGSTDYAQFVARLQNYYHTLDVLGVEYARGYEFKGRNLVTAMKALAKDAYCEFNKQQNAQIKEKK